MNIVELRVAIVASVMLVGAVGCVTQGTFDELESEFGVVRAANSDMEQEIAMLRQEKAQLVGNLAKAKGELNATQKDIKSMAETRDQLVSELKSELASGQIQIRKAVGGISLGVSDELLFPSGGASVNAKGREVLGRVASKLKADSTLVFVEGHTDNVRISKTLQQKYPTNWELGGARAASVVRVLSDAGVDPMRLQAVSRGPFAPLASNDTAEGRARNRRTEIILRPNPNQVGAKGTPPASQ